MRPRIGETVRQTFPDDPADDYLSAAYRLIHEARRFTGSLADLAVKQNALLASMSSFLSLEASINRLFYDVFENQSESRRSVRDDVPSTVISYTRFNWSRLSIRDKFLLLPPLISANSPFEFAVKAEPFSLFEEVIRFRNRLVHPRMLEHGLVVQVKEVDFEADSGSWRGEVIEHWSTAPIRQELFPLTQLSTSFNDLKLQDAEIVFEVALRMRVTLSRGVWASPPSLIFVSESGVPQVKIGSSIAELITLRFGPLLSDDPG